MKNSRDWYIIKLSDGTCDITQVHEMSNQHKCFGKYSTLEEALAKRVGLIRAKKCKPK